jgi:hypothetical protein
MSEHLFEDAEHLFLKYKVVKQAWQNLDLVEIHDRMSEHQTTKTMISV